MTAKSSKPASSWTIVAPIFIAAGLVFGGLILLLSSEESKSPQQIEQTREEKSVTGIEPLNLKAQFIEEFDHVRRSIMASLKAPGNSPPVSAQLELDPLPFALTYQNSTQIEPELLAAANTLVVDYRALATPRGESPTEAENYPSKEAIPWLFDCGPCHNVVLYQDIEQDSTLTESLLEGGNGVSPAALQLMEQLEYVVVLKILEYVSPELVGNSASKSGVLKVESTLWDAKSGKLLGKFESQAVNGEVVVISSDSGSKEQETSDNSALKNLQIGLLASARKTIFDDLAAATGGNFIK